MANISGIMQLYTAYFNRAADKAGVDYWAGMMDSNEWSLDDVAQSFSDQVEYQNQYNGLTQTQIVEQVYQNVLNRAGEAGGINYWSGELSSGNISVSQLVNAIVNASVEKDGNGNYKNSTDATIFNNKIQVSQYCYDNNVNATENNAISLSSITTDFSSVSSVKAIASGFIDNSNNITPAFELTTEWLNGKTLYNIYDDNNDGILNDYATFTFSETSFTASEGLVNNHDFSTTYEIIDNGIMYVSPMEVGDDYGYVYVTNILSDQDGEYGFEIVWADSLDSIPNDGEFFLFDRSSAEDFNIA